MRNFQSALVVAGALAFATTGASAAIVSVNDPIGVTGDVGSGPAAIISAPAQVFEDSVTNTAMQGFDEAQNVTLTSAISTDTGTIAAGTFVSSHMIFLNTDGLNQAEHRGVEWTFSNRILGVMSGNFGADEVASTPQLRAPGTDYPMAPFGNRGFEPGQDEYTIIAPNTIRVGMFVTEPGDWMRVVTAAIPLPAAFPLLGGALALLGVAGLRRRNKS